MDAALLINSCCADGKNPPDRTSLCVVTVVLSFFAQKQAATYQPSSVRTRQLPPPLKYAKSQYHRQCCHWLQPAPRIPASTTCNGCVFEFPETMRHAVPGSVYPSAINCPLGETSLRHNDPLKIVLPNGKDVGSPPACTLCSLTVH